MKAPKRIDQVVHVLAARDAIGAHVLMIRDALLEAGFESEIYAYSAQAEVEQFAKLASASAFTDPSFSDRGRRAFWERWLWCHHSTGSPVIDLVIEASLPTIVDYHNVTPYSLIGEWVPALRDELLLGMKQLSDLARMSFLGVAHSRFSEIEMKEAGWAHTTVLPPFADLSSLRSGSDVVVDESMAKDRVNGGSDWLFVGRLSPHKAQHDLLKAFHCYRTFYDPLARLHLVGSAITDDYLRSLKRFAGRLAIADAVRFHGSVTPEALASYYKGADVFVCLSDHEGFCVPLAEAMYMGLPVVAFDTSAVGETVGDGGLLLDDKQPMSVATAVHKALSDARLRDALCSAGKHRADNFDPRLAKTRVAQAIDLAIGLSKEALP